MEVFAIPVEGEFILYRPRLQLAFVGNQAMADLVVNLASLESPSEANAPEEAMAFLRTIGFLEPDPPPLPLPDHTFRPTSAVLLLTNRCNLRCTYCYAAGGEGPAQDLSLELARVAIDHVYHSAAELEQPYFELTFHGGGEPVQAWETVQAATAYARTKDLPCRTSMVTNGVWTARQREWILHNIDSLSISFDGRQETQDRQRPSASGRGSFKAVMRTIRALDKAGFSYGIRMTVTAPWQELPEDVRFICEETGCQGMQAEPAFNTRRGEHQGPTQKEGAAFVAAFMEAFEVAQQAGRRLTYSGARPWLVASTFCTAPYGALVVNAAGNLVVCYEIAGETHPLAAMSTIGRIVDSQVTVDHQAREAMLAYLEEKRAACRECFCYWHCAGDCYTRSFYAQAGGRRGWVHRGWVHRGWVHPGANPRCEMNRQITAQTLLWYIMAGDGLWRGQGMNPQEAQLMRTF